MEKTKQRNDLVIVVASLLIVFSMGVFSITVLAYMGRGIEARVTCLESGHRWSISYLGPEHQIENTIYLWPAWKLTCSRCGKEEVKSREFLTEEDYDLMEKQWGVKPDKIETKELDSSGNEWLDTEADDTIELFSYSTRPFCDFPTFDPNDCVLPYDLVIQERLGNEGVIPEGSRIFFRE